MLVLTRKANEKIILGEKGEVEITILSLKGNHAKVGINAPKSTPIYREEIYLKMQEEGCSFDNNNSDFFENMKKHKK